MKGFFWIYKNEKIVNYHFVAGYFIIKEHKTVDCKNILMIKHKELFTFLIKYSTMTICFTLIHILKLIQYR